MLFPQNVIALIWDFDKTLIPGYMWEPLFRHFKVDPKKFWDEVSELREIHGNHGSTLISKDILWLNHILRYVREGAFAGLSNDLLERIGQELLFFPGIPEFFERINEKVKKEYEPDNIILEHYIVSNGLRRMILGSAVAPYVKGVWGCEFLEGDDGVIRDIGYVIDNTTKTRAIFEINKGTNVLPEIDVNAFIKPEDRRVPVENMIYIADGPSDVPVFSVVNKGGGKTFAVYPKGSERDFAQVNELQKQGRVQSVGEADYTERSKTYLWIMHSVREIAERIIRDRSRAVSDKVGLPPRHLSE